MRWAQEGVSIVWVSHAQYRVIAEQINKTFDGLLLNIKKWKTALE